MDGLWITCREVLENSLLIKPMVNNEESELELYINKKQILEFDPEEKEILMVNGRTYKLTKDYDVDKIAPQK